MYRLFNLFFLLLFIAALFSCHDKKSVKIPKFYFIELTWGTYFQPNKIIHARVISSGDSMTIFISDSHERMSEMRSFRIEKQIADSIFILTYLNSKAFDLLDSNSFGISDGKNLSITMHANGLTVKNIYASGSVGPCIDEIKKLKDIIGEITKDTTMFN